MSKLKKIVITGGIGSGKSTVGAILRKLGYKVYDSDKIYADLLENQDVVKELSSAVGVFPKLCENGRLVFDKTAVADKVFKNKESLDKLNSLSHQLVYDKIDLLCDENSKEKIIFFEIPLLFESGRENCFDQVIVVMRDKIERIEAVRKRSNLSNEQVLKRMDNQIDYDNLPKDKHTFIYNDGDLASLELKLKELLKSLEK